MVDFNRKDYLEYSEEFETDSLDYADNELCEFNYDPEALAFELAYTRYELAKLEKLFEMQGILSKEYVDRFKKGQLLSSDNACIEFPFKVEDLTSKELAKAIQDHLACGFIRAKKLARKIEMGHKVTWKDYYDNLGLLETYRNI